MNQYTPDCPIALHLHNVKKKCPFMRACIRSDKGMYDECGHNNPKNEIKVDETKLVESTAEGKP